MPTGLSKESSLRTAVLTLFSIELKLYCVSPVTFLCQDCSKYTSVNIPHHREAVISALVVTENFVTLIRGKILIRILLTLNRKILCLILKSTLSYINISTAAFF